MIDLEPPIFATLIEMLEYRATHDRETAAFHFAGRAVHYGELWRDIGDFAARLIECGVAIGDKVVLTVPNGPEFFTAFYGIQRAGAVAVPLFPNFSPDRIMAFADICGARLIVVPSNVPVERLGSFQRLAGRRGRTVVEASERMAGSQPPPLPIIGGDDVAFVQFTSGSTGEPKGVQISQANLLTNITQMISGMEITKRDIFVSWLPIYHDMGLILMTMVPFYLRLELHLLPTNLQDAAAWPRAIETHAATFTAAPDFAYRLCTRRIENPGAYDLSTLRVALNAAEPVRMKTIADFEAAFGLRHVVTPAYGLAEATVGVSIWPPNRPPKQDAQGHVSVGRPFPDVGIEIVSDGAPVATGIVGEIAIRSTALPRGYLDNPGANAALFRRDGFVLSGDLGYLDAEGDLFVVGRKKNTIIQAGRTLYPAEVEAVVDLDPAVRYSICVGIDSDGIEGEQAFVFAEVQDGLARREPEFQDTVIRIAAALHRELGFRPGRTILLEPKTIPMTYNGKFQHQRLKDMYVAGQLRESGRIVFAV